MLKKAALSQRALKKRIYIAYLKFQGLLNAALWHATTSDEATDITSHFPKNKGVLVAPNIPKPPSSILTPVSKKRGELRLVYLSLINEHKNLLLLLEAIKGTTEEVSLDIYGPVVDEDYWSRCIVLIKQMPGKVQYKGQVEPPLVQDILSQYHALILLTKGENFGHAIYECLSVGRPVITSMFTPWSNLEPKKAGANIDIINTRDCILKINKLTAMEQDEFNTYCSNSYVLAKNYYSSASDIEKYNELFSE